VHYENNNIIGEIMQSNLFIVEVRITTW